MFRQIWHFATKNCRGAGIKFKKCVKGMEASRDSRSRKLKLSVKVASSPRSINFCQNLFQNCTLMLGCHFGAKMEIKVVSAVAALTSSKKLFSNPIEVCNLSTFT